MLSATYFYSIISIEQKNFERVLSEIEWLAENKSPEKIPKDAIEYVQEALDKVRQIDAYWRTRKVETYLIPAMRGISEKSDLLLAELDRLGSTAIQFTQNIQEQMTKNCAQGISNLEAMQSSMQQYCQLLHRKLREEEDLLYPMASELLSLDAWFDIAAKCLADQSQYRGRNKLTVQAAKPSLPTQSALLTKSMPKQSPALGKKDPDPMPSSAAFARVKSVPAGVYGVPSGGFREAQRSAA